MFTALPSEGYEGGAPDFLLPAATAREIEVWQAAWMSPQACAWVQQPWRWYTVAQWVRWTVRAEASDAPASIIAGVIRLADQIGLTPAGLKENGWAIAADELAKRASDKPKQAQPTERRLRIAAGDGGE